MEYGGDERTMLKKIGESYYVFSGNASAHNLRIEIDTYEKGNLKKEAVFLHQLLYDNLPGETYEELMRLMKEVRK